MRTSERQVNKILKKQVKNVFSQMLADLTTQKEVETFLSDFFTESELETFMKRLAIAYWLKKGRSYANIKNNLKVSSATVASIQTEMQKEGYKLALKKAEAEEWANQWSEKIKNMVKK